MEMLEERALGVRKRGYIRMALLASVAVSGTILVAAAAPKIFGALESVPAIKRARLKYQAKTVLGRLAVQGLVTFEQHGGKKFARITDAGRNMLAIEEQKANLSLEKRKRKWDRRWRVIIFDIPERRRKTRDQLRKTMKDLSFVRLQDSVWVFPFDCEDFVALLKADLRIGAAVLYMIVEQIENDKHLRAHFGLVET